MKTHRIYKSLALSFLMVIPAVRCQSSDKVENVSGVWEMEDTSKMAKFLGLKDSPKGYYCMEFNPQEGKARVRFLYSKVSHSLQVRPTGTNRYRLLYGKDARDVFIDSDTSASTGEIDWYWHFSDSSPYNPKDLGIYDGVKDPKNETLEQCIKNLQEDYEFAIHEHPLQ